MDLSKIDRYLVETKYTKGYTIYDYKGLMEFVPEYRRLQNMSKKDLINKLGYLLYKQREYKDSSKLRDCVREVAVKRIPNIEMAHRIYMIMFNDQKIEW